MKNIEVDSEENMAIISVNPKLYALEVIYAAAYVLIDKAYFILDGNPEEEIKVLMKPKSKMSNEEINELALKFHDELVNYSVYVMQAAKNQAVREAIIKRAFATNIGGSADDIEVEIKNYPKDLKDKAKAVQIKEKDLYIEDPKGIAKPWTPKKERPAGSEKDGSKRK